MKCNEAHLKIAGLTGDDLPDDLARHVQSCPACAQLLATDERLRRTLRTETVVPAYALGRIRTAIAESEAAPSRKTWIESLMKSRTTMKLTLPALLALAIGATFVALPRPAAATSPKPRATFAKMKRAVLATAKQNTDISIRVGKGENGSVGAWVVIDGELTELKPNTPFHRSTDGAEITVTTSQDLSNVPPEQRAEVEKAIAEAVKNGKTGKVHVSTSINGKPVSPDEARALLHQAGIDMDMNVDIDLDDKHYSSIEFGPNESTLILTPKSRKDRHLVVQLDPKSSLPRNVLLRRKTNGKWVDVRRTKVTLK